MLLRPIEEGDRAEFVRVHRRAEPLYTRWIGALEPGQTWEDIFERVLATGATHDNVRLVGLLSDGRLAGCFNLGQIVGGFFQCGTAEWRTDPELWSRGYGTEGARGLLDLAFRPPPDGLGLHRVQAHISPDNVASLRLAEKVGFRKEGLALKALKIAGVWQDHLLFAKLAEEHAIQGAA